MTKDNTDFLLPPNGIEQSVAIGNIGRWQAQSQLTACTFHYEELKQVHAMIEKYNKDRTAGKVNALRFYLGIKKGADDTYLPCMMVVPVSGFDPTDVSIGGDDIVNLFPDQYDATIFDFSYPCPDTCANEGHCITDPC